MSLIKVPKTTSIVTFSHIDKIEHVIAYFALSITWLLALTETKKSIIIISCLLYGGLMEFLQAILTNYRSAEFADFLANSLGIMLGLLTYSKILIKKNIKM